MNIKQIDSEKLIGIVALLVHAAKIDDNYTEKEKKIIISFIENFEQNSREIQEKLKKSRRIRSKFKSIIKLY